MRSSLEDLSSVLKIPEQDLKRKLDGVREKLSGTGRSGSIQEKTTRSWPIGTGS
jgi:hypothetical protein